jgi:hypothetical protein
MECERQNVLHVSLGQWCRNQHALERLAKPSTLGMYLGALKRTLQRWQQLT